CHFLWPGPRRVPGPRTGGLAARFPRSAPQPLPASLPELPPQKKGGLSPTHLARQLKSQCSVFIWITEGGGMWVRHERGWETHIGRTSRGGFEGQMRRGLAIRKSRAG